MKVRYMVLSLYATILCSVVFQCSEQDETPASRSQATSGANRSKSNLSARTSGSEFNIDVGSPIAFELFSKWKDAYASKNPDGVESHFFGANAFARILDQEGTVGISIFYGIDENGEQQLMMVGVDKFGGVVQLSADSLGNNILIMDESFRCPPVCPVVE